MAPLLRHLDVDTSQALRDFLTQAFPWTGTHIAWHTLQGTQMLDWGGATDAEAVAFVRSLSIAHHAEIAILTCPAEPVAIYPLMYLLGHLNTIGGRGCQQYFAFGLSGGEIVRALPAEFETGCTIWGHASAV